jgi:hypothetical protein
VFVLRGDFDPHQIRPSAARARSALHL